MIASKRTRTTFTVVLTIWALVTIIPFVWMLIASFLPSLEIVRVGGGMPHDWTLSNYLELFTRLNFGVYLKNTIIVTAAGMFSILFNAMAGYGFARYSFPAKNAMFVAILATMMIPGQVTMIPVYLELNAMGLTNTYLGIILPGLAGAFGVFLFRQFFANMPEDIFEAARVDGAGDAYTFFRIALPLAGPIVAVQAILTFIGGWNSFLWPLIVANEERLYTLSVGLNLLQGQHAADYGLQMAGAAFMVVPILVVFLLAQKHILSGFDISGDK